MNKFINEIEKNIHKQLSQQQKNLEHLLSL